MSGNYTNDLKQMSRLIINFNFLSYSLCFWLIYVTVNIQNVLLWLECRRENVCTTVQCNNALFHTNLHINKTPPQISHILRFCLVDSLPQIL